MNCPWGEKALGNYLGEDREAWLDYDSCALVAGASEQLPVLVDQGDADDFLQEQLHTHLLQEACELADYPMTIRMQEGYDHSYFFIASFIGEHLAFHAGHL
jgi:S-formylglutathione hydrolase